MSKLTGAVSDYFFGTELKKSYSELRGLYGKFLEKNKKSDGIQIFRINNLKLHLDEHLGGDEYFVLGVHKKLPNIVDLCSVVISIFGQTPEWLVGIGFGEAYRVYMMKNYNSIRKRLNNEINNLHNFI